MNEDELVELLKKTISAIDRAEVPEDLRSEAFRAVWSSLAGTLGTGYQPSSEKGESLGSSASSTPWSQLATRLAVEPDLLKDVYDLLGDGTFAVRVPTSALPKAKSTATRELALLVCAGRQSSVEESTHADVIRVVCQDYGKFDSGNHAANMAEGDKYWQISGNGKNRRYKLRKSGWEEASDIVRRIAGG